MVTVDEFSRLVSGIYAAATTPPHWERALREIHRTMGGIGGSLARADGAIWSVEDTSMPAEAMKSYAEYYRHLDHMLAAVKSGPVGAVRTGSELMDRRSEFFVGWLRPNGCEDGLLVRLSGGPRATCFIVAAPRLSEAFDTPERVKLMSGLVPHVQQALRTQDKLAALADSAVELEGALEVVRHGVIIVAGEHLVINLNSTAERILRAHDGLYMRSARIAATSTHAEQELHCAIHNALAGEFRSHRPVVHLCSALGQAPLRDSRAALPPPNAYEPPRPPMALVLIVDPEEEPEPAAALLRRLYRLTEAEAEVALHVMHGADLKQISEELSISYTTVRSHLQHIFDKTDTHRQAELVHLLLVLSP